MLTAPQDSRLQSKAYKKAVQGEPRDAAVNFDTYDYRILQ